MPTAGFVVPTLDAAELERRVAELRAVESWLIMNLSLLRMSIQGLEMQQATLAALKGAEKMAAAPGANPIFDAWVSALKKQGGQATEPDKDK